MDADQVTAHFLLPELVGGKLVRSRRTAQVYRVNKCPHRGCPKCVLCCKWTLSHSDETRSMIKSDTLSTTESNEGVLLFQNYYELITNQ